MKVLVISPNLDDLRLSSRERDALVNLLGAQQLSGESATVAYVIDKLADESFDVVWFVSHGNGEGILMNDGEMLTPDVLSTALRGTATQLVFINTCESEAAGLRIYAATNIPVVCTLLPIGDSAAYGVARRFARLVADGRGLQSAYRLVRSSEFRWIPDVGPVSMDGEYLDAEATLAELVEIVNRHETQLEEHGRLHAEHRKGLKKTGERNEEISEDIKSLIQTIHDQAKQIKELVDVTNAQSTIMNTQAEHLVNLAQANSDMQRIQLGIIGMVVLITFVVGLRILVTGG